MERRPLWASASAVSTRTAFSLSIRSFEMSREVLHQSKSREEPQWGRSLFAPVSEGRAKVERRQSEPSLGGRVTALRFAVSCLAGYVVVHVMSG